MITNYWTLAVLTILYLCWCEVRADQKSNKLNKLEFWKRETVSNETRRQQKKQTRREKYPRTFQAVEDINEPNQILSYDEAHTVEINKHKDENQHERSLLSGSNENNPSSLIVWQNYVKEDKFKDMKENSLKFTKNYRRITDTGGTEIKNNFAIDHIHFKKYSNNERIHNGKTAKVRKENESTEIINPHQPVYWKKLNIIKTSPKYNSRKTSRTPIYYTKRQGETTIPDREPFSLYSPKENSKEVSDNFLSPYAISQQMTRILSSFRNTNVSTEILGRSAEFNDIMLFKISANRNDTNRKFRSLDVHKYDDENLEKKIIFIVHGLSVMGLNSLSCLTKEYELKILLGYYLQHLDKFDIFLIPMANPDGYVANLNKKYWNKNMSPQADCRGVALDRNFDVAWNDTHDLSSCGQSYPGPNPFSEIETKAISNVFHFHGHRIVAYIHVHAGTYDTTTFKGDAILYPRGYTDVPGDDDKYLDIKGEVEEAMRNATFRVMSVTMDNLYHWYGKVTGCSVDYAAQVFGIPFALEFVMQLYENAFPMPSQEAELVDYNALTQIWKRIIYVVFKHFAKSVGIIHEDDEK